ncbi:hypothetical protein GCM10007916_28650 [Psychromonas marina]|uniref:LysM domain-containing protein n=1 Tax=Psychromonas marina TaxID=88364 RepID=A0ABQ6E3A2_9GAMM|nr:LysM peptidoglycan-binding domain-containing protein [Psychromonas marina]GLS91795.1 hypothetical protein GCM10007916_28650 [Psychromonas marina]
MIRSYLFSNQIFKFVSLTSCVIFPQVVQANFILENKDDFSFHAHSGYAIGKDDQSDMTLLSVGAGYEFFPNLYINGAISSFVGNSAEMSDSLAGELYLTWDQPLSEDFSVYADLGGRSAGGSLLAGVGVRRHLSPSWSVDLGYRYYNEPHNKQQGDIYALQLGVKYTFAEKKTPRVIESDIYVAPSKKVVVPPELTQCGGEEYRVYNVVKDDNFHKIAGKLAIQAEELIDLNRCKFEDVNLIYPDDEVYYPEKIELCANNTGDIYYVVKDDNFHKIAGKLAIQAEELIDLNRCNFEDVNLIYPGDEVFLPIK